jgi:hypothetical protein
MKLSYVIPALLFGLGLGLLILGTSSTTDVTLFGLTFHPRIGKGLGIIVMIFSAITFLALFGNAQPSSEVERRAQARPGNGETRDPHDDAERRSALSRRP